MSKHIFSAQISIIPDYFRQPALFLYNHQVNFRNHTEKRKISDMKSFENPAEQFRDNCGFGLLASLRNQPSHQLLEDAVRALSRMMHRGAIAADGKTGDGCGLLCAMPDSFMRQTAEKKGVSLPGHFAVGTLFLSDAKKQKELFAATCEKNDMQVVLFREVPLNLEALGAYARERLPVIVQAFVAPRELIATKRFDALLYLTRREVEHALEDDQEFYISNLSRTLISYKGLVMPNYLRQLYPDLADSEFKTRFVLFHQHFFQPTLCRNGAWRNRFAKWPTTARSTRFAVTGLTLWPKRLP